jgi:ribonucleoside-diphosphate reductase beta chain
MLKTAEQFQYIARDEQSHVAFGLELIRAFIAEHPDCVDERFRAEVATMAERACDLETQFIERAMPSPMVGYNAEDHALLARHYAERWLARIGITVDLGGAHRMPWIDEMVATKKEKNFFETRVTEYQLGRLSFDDNDATPNDNATPLPFPDWWNPTSTQETPNDRPTTNHPNRSPQNNPRPPRAQQA